MNYHRDCKTSEERETSLKKAQGVTPATHSSAKRRVWSAKAVALLLAGAQLWGAASGAQAGTAAATEIIAPDLPAPSNSSLTAPNSGVFINGTRLDSNGVPVRHLWLPDHLKGICRVDIDTAGKYFLNDATCISFIGGAAIKPGQLAYDPNTQNLYSVDLSAKTQGVFRIRFTPDADNGDGRLDQFNASVLGGANAGCGIPGNIPNSASLGPDNNLYIGFKRSGNIVRVVNPSVDPLPCGNVQTIGATADGKKNFGFGWIGHDLYGADGLSAWVIPKADQCFTAANNFSACKGSSILVGQVPAPSIATTDQVYPAQNGTTLYVGTPTSVVAVKLSSAPVVVDTNFGTGFSFVAGLAVDMANPANKVVYAADDPTNGAGVGSGRLWTLTTPAPQAAAPGAPTNVKATAKPEAAALSWAAGSSGSQPITSYTITTTSANTSVPAVPPLTVTIVPPASTPPTFATVTGLVDTTTYDFTITATNSVGTSPASASVSATPAAATLPSAPQNVTALAGNASASVAWTAPTTDGNSPLTGYTVTASSPTGVIPAASNVVPSTTGTVVTGLTNGASYTFTVAAVNAMGSTTSPATSPVTPSAASGSPDMAIAMTGPASINFGADATYTITATNNGPSNAEQVIVTDTLPATGATLVGTPVPTQGSCLVAAGQPVTCNLGTINAGSSVTVPVTLNVTGNIVNNAAVKANTAAGVALTDPNPANNTAKVATAIAVATTTTDLQATGSAKTGGPAVNTSDTFTWQIKNSGKSAANAATFTVSNPSPGSLSFTSFTSSIGTCTGPDVNGDIRCTADSLAAGQTMTVTVNVFVSGKGSFATTGKASFSGTDTNPGNDTATITIQVK
jgi:uncharacterized repeat protein (TIGR01451 family)